MATTIPQSISAAYTTSEEKVSLTGRFFNWCKAQESNRLLWLGLILAVHGCILTPITVMAVLAAGAGFSLFMVAMVSMGMALVTNLAAMPTRITIPVFAFSILLDLGILIASIAIGLR